MEILGIKINANSKSAFTCTSFKEGVQVSGTQSHACLLDSITLKHGGGISYLEETKGVC